MTVMGYREIPKGHPFDGTRIIFGAKRPDSLQKNSTPEGSQQGPLEKPLYKPLNYEKMTLSEQNESDSKALTSSQNSSSAEAPDEIASQAPTKEKEIK
jgi:hypothetical protein